MDFQLVLRGCHHFLGRFNRSSVRRELFDNLAGNPRRDLTGAGPLVTEPLVFTREPGFEVLYFLGQLGRQALDGLQPILLLEKRFKAQSVTDKGVIDSESFGFVVKLMALAFKNIALPLVLFDTLIELV